MVSEPVGGQAVPGSERVGAMQAAAVARERMVPNPSGSPPALPSPTQPSRSGGWACCGSPAIPTAPAPALARWGRPAAQLTLLATRRLPRPAVDCRRARLHSSAAVAAPSSVASDSAPSPQQ